MPACVSCGREIPPAPVGELNICPECRAAIQARAPSQNPLPARRRTLALQNMPVTSALIGISVLVFVLMVLSGVSFSTPDLEQLVKWGADWGPYTLVNQPWRLLTSNYVHIGIIHIALNMWCLWNLGALAERIFDRWTYVLGYTACGIAGSIVGVWWRPMLVAAGASGAIFGIAGMLIAALYLGHLPVHPSALKATLKSLLSFAGYNLFFGAVIPGISNAAHLGGFITGLGLGTVLAPRLTAPPDERNSWRRWIFIVAGVLLLVLFRVVRRAVLPALAGPGGQ
jgi:rhomboid protease GluP